MNNPHTLMSDVDLALLLIGLAGYPDDDLCRQGAVIEAELLSRHQGHYPAWFTPAQIAVCQTLQRYLPRRTRALDSVKDRTPAFFNDHLPLIEMARRLAQSGMSLHWNAQLRALEIIEGPLPPSTPVYPQP